MQNSQEHQLPRPSRRTLRLPDVVEPPNIEAHDEFLLVSSHSNHVVDRLIFPHYSTEAVLGDSHFSRTGEVLSDSYFSAGEVLCVSHSSTAVVLHDSLSSREAVLISWRVKGGCWIPGKQPAAPFQSEN